MAGDQVESCREILKWFLADKRKFRKDFLRKRGSVAELIKIFLSNTAEGKL